MNPYVELLGRARARSSGRALPARCTYMVVADPSPVFAMAPIRVVSEERIQAIAYGHLPGPASVTAIWNPLGRESHSLDGFAEALNRYIIDAVAAGRLPRVWVPHRAALQVLEILGHRYRKNSSATEEIRQMGQICWALATEAQHPGQQAVVIAGDALANHVVTGQSPKEDAHLGSLLTWVTPPNSTDVVIEANRVALTTPASSVLQREEDDEVEKLRALAKRYGNSQRASVERGKIEAILGNAALREWDLLIRAWTAFWGLDLQLPKGLGDLGTRSLERLSFSTQLDRSKPNRPDSLARLLGDQERDSRYLQRVALLEDALIREQLRAEGHVMALRLDAIDQQRSNHKPCFLHLSTDQAVSRLRVGRQIQPCSNNIIGRILELRHESVGRVSIRVEIISGVRTVSGYSLGAVEDWVESYRDTTFQRHQLYRRLRQLAPPLVYGDVLPPDRPRQRKTVGS